MRKLLIVLAAFAFVVAYTVPAMAASEFSFYGHARMLTFNTTVSEEASATGYEDTDLGWNTSGSGRFGCRAKAGDIRGRWEVGTEVNLRLLYAYWEFGAGKLLVGQDYTPGDFFPSGMVYGDNSMVSYGAAYSGRRPQVKLLLMNDALQIALVEPSTAGLAGETDTTIPKIEAAYSLKAGPASLVIFAGMNTADQVDAADDAVSVDSNVFGVGFKIPLGALYLNGDVWMSTNPGNYGMTTNGGIGTATVDVEDCDTMAYALVVGYKISDMLKIEAGYGFASDELGDASSEKSIMYVQLPITLAKNVWIIPEIGSVDYGDLENAVTVDQGDMSYWGAKWEIRF
jgi:hypothetical protein